MNESGAIDSYLAQVSSRLPGGPGVRRDVIDELRDGLTQTLQHRALPTGRDAAETLRREFGDPRQIGAQLAAELRLRLARRNAAVVLLLQVTGAIGWQTYHSLVGVADSTVPTGWARPVFLTAIESLQACATLAAIGAACTALMISLPARRSAAAKLSPWTARITLTALAGFALSALSVLASIAPGHRLGALLVGIPVAAIMVPAIGYAHRTTRHLAALRSVSS
jgi:hypothetical protein